MSAILDAVGVVKRFTAGAVPVPAVDGVDMAVRAGEALAITGPSGSGKSTLLALLAGLERPDAGMVRVEGADLATMPDAALARLRGTRLGFVFQSYRLLGALTALENVALPLELAGVTDARMRAAAWLDRVGLAQRIGHRPGQLSGGEQQRVAIARALAPEPVLVLADEPTGNLDGRTGAQIIDLLLDLVRSSGAALVVVTHDDALATRMDRRLAMRDGKVVG